MRRGGEIIEENPQASEKQMQPRKCTSCGESDLYFGQMTEGFVMGPSLLSNHARPMTAVCLSCGAVHHYLPVDELAKVKAWKAKEHESNLDRL